MNIQKMMRQAQEMQANMAKAQEALAEKTVEASVGGGKVVVTGNGAGDILAIKISPDVIDPEDPEMLSRAWCSRACAMPWPNDATSKRFGELKIQLCGLEKPQTQPVESAGQGKMNAANARIVAGNARVH